MENESMQSVDLYINNKKYTVKGESSPEDMKMIAAYLDAKIERTIGKGRILTTDDMILVAMNVAQDAMRLNEEKKLACEKLEKADKRLEDFAKLWEKAKSGFRQASGESAVLKEEKEQQDDEIKKLVKDVMELKRLLREAEKENDALREEFGIAPKGSRDVIDGQMQIKLPSNL